MTGKGFMIRIGFVYFFLFLWVAMIAQVAMDREVEREWVNKTEVHLWSSAGIAYYWKLNTSSDRWTFALGPGFHVMGFNYANAGAFLDVQRVSGSGTWKRVFGYQLGTGLSLSTTRADIEDVFVNNIVYTGLQYKLTQDLLLEPAFQLRHIFQPDGSLSGAIFPVLALGIKF